MEVGDDRGRRHRRESSQGAFLPGVDSPAAMESVTASGPSDAAATNGAGIPVENPATGETLAHVPELSAAQVEAIVAAARQAQPAWEAAGFEERGRVLMAARAWMVANGERVVETICAETGRPADETQFAELAYGISALEFWAKQAPGYLADEEIESASPFVRGGRRMKVRYAPVGVVGVIGPWNYPLNNSFGDCIPALAAGNAVVLKPSEITPLTSLLMAEMMAEAGLPEGVFQVATGRGETGAALVDLVDYVMFTGSVKTGKRVMKQAADTLTPVSLELGGKDPMIVLADADLERAANAAASYGLNNSGQVCISVERIYVEDAGPRRVRRAAHREGRGAAPGPARRARHGRRRGDHLPAPDRPDRRPRQGRGRARRQRRHRRRGGGGAGPLLRADRAHRRRPLDALHDRGDVRPDAAGDAGRRRRGGGRPRQRRPLRAAGFGLDARHRSRRGARAPDRGGRRLRQRRAGQLRRARAADGRLEGVRPRLAPRPRRDPQVREAPVDPGRARLRAAARAAHVPLRRRGHRTGRRGDGRLRRQRALRRRAAGDARRLLRHVHPLADASGRERRGRPDRLLGALRVRLRRPGRGRARPAPGRPSRGPAARAARAARRASATRAWSPRPRRRPARRSCSRSPPTRRRASGWTRCATPRSASTTRCPTSAPASTRTGRAWATRGRRRCPSPRARSTGRSCRSSPTARS